MPYMSIERAKEYLEEMQENCKTRPFCYKDEKAALKAEAIKVVLIELERLKGGNNYAGNNFRG